MERHVWREETRILDVWMKWIFQILYPHILDRGFGGSSHRLYSPSIMLLGKPDMVA